VHNALGRRFFSRRRSEYVVQIQVIKRGRKDNGTTYEVNGWMPITDLGLRNISLPQRLTIEQRDEQIKAAVMRYLSDGLEVYEVSQEVWRYDAHGAWIIRGMPTQPGPGHDPYTEVITRRLGVRPVRMSQLPHPDGICAEAFEDHDDDLCAPRQIAAVLRWTWATSCGA
jgi:hypothetical protein